MVDTNQNTRRQMEEEVGGQPQEEEGVWAIAHIQRETTTGTESMTVNWIDCNPMNRRRKKKKKTCNSASQTGKGGGINER